jgi:hypothetical protein
MKWIMELFIKDNGQRKATVKEKELRSGRTEASTLATGKMIWQTVKEG